MFKILAFCDGMEFPVKVFDNAADMIRAYREKYIHGAPVNGFMRPCRMLLPD